MKEKKHIIAFPHMGNIFVPVRAILEGLGLEVVIPPYNNKQVLELGVKHSIEDICLPYKLNLANYIMALDMGATTFVMFQAPGTCRLGNYTKIASKKMQQLGYNFEMVIFDMYKGGMVDILKKVYYITKIKNPLVYIRAFRLGFKKFFAVDEMEKRLLYTRPREIIKGLAEKTYKKAIKRIDEAKTSREMKKLMPELHREFDKIEIDTQKYVPVVYLVGEFFILLDPFTNMEIEKELGNLGIEVQRQIMFSYWLEHVLKPGLFYKKLSHRQRAIKYAKNYIQRPIGGECLESVGDVVMAAQKNIDGVIHLSPFTCMPEIMATNILNRVSKNENIPILSLIFDEQTGKAGVITRIEAFADLIKRRKQKLSALKSDKVAIS